MLMIKTILYLTLLGIGVIAFGDTVPTTKPSLYTQVHLVSSTLWTEKLKRFQKHLPTNPDAARTELENAAENLFGGHLLAEEWVPLYFRISRDGTEYLSDVKRVSELEIRMLTVINAKKHAEQIRQHRAVLKHYKQEVNDAAVKEEQVDSQKMQAVKKLRAETIDKHIAAYEKLLPTDPDAAHAALVKYAQVTFGEHTLRKEWIELYFRLSSEQKSTFPEFIQLLNSTKQMLEDNFPDIAAEAIAKLDAGLKVMSLQQGFSQEKFPLRFDLSALK